jgi:hypothetical protein
VKPADAAGPAILALAVLIDGIGTQVLFVVQ